jgi:hypothetical protein
LTPTTPTIQAITNTKIFTKLTPAVKAGGVTFLNKLYKKKGFLKDLSYN